MSEPPGVRGPKRSRSSAAWRGTAALLTFVTSVGTAVAFLFVAWVIATFNCEDGCALGSRWAPGAWGAAVELWALAVPAVLAAFVLVWAVATGRRYVSLLAWATTIGLLVGWCVFTSASAVTIDFSQSNSHWMWLVGLLVTGGGGLAGVAVSFLKPSGTRPPAGRVPIE